MTYIALAFVIGRIIFGLYWLENSYKHLFRGRGMIEYARSKGVRAAPLAIYGTGLLLLVGGFSILLGYKPTYGIICLLIFLLGVTLKMHDFWNVEDPSQRNIQRINFYKNLALFGALLMLLSVPQPWTYSL